jgi:hypothetical protein
MNRLYIIDALSAILEDILNYRLTFPFRAEFEAFFEPEEFEMFQDMVMQEFDLEDITILESAETFNELIALLEDELFF